MTAEGPAAVATVAVICNSRADAAIAVAPATVAAAFTLTAFVVVGVVVGVASAERALGSARGVTGITGAVDTAARARPRAGVCICESDCVCDWDWLGAGLTDRPGRDAVPLVFALAGALETKTALTEAAAAADRGVAALPRGVTTPFAPGAAATARGRDLDRAGVALTLALPPAEKAAVVAAAVVAGAGRVEKCGCGAAAAAAAAAAASAAAEARNACTVVDQEKGSM